MKTDAAEVRKITACTTLHLSNLYKREPIENSQLPMFSREFPYHFPLLLRRTPALDQRANYGAPRFKPRIARTRPSRTPTMLALDNFDFYYGPMFGKEWPSIRLALLSRKKFAAVLNRFATNFETNKEIMRNLGALNLMEEMAMAPEKEVSERVRKLKGEMDKKASEARLVQQQSEEEEQNQPLNEEEEEDIESRLEVGLNTFQPPDNVIDQDAQKKRKKRRKWNEDEEEEEEFNSKRIIYDSKFKITGLEGTDEHLPVVEDVLIYPRDLHVYAHPRMIIEGFPEPLRDRNHINGWWLLDGGSVLPVLALDLQEDDLVLDMCAAPGGKSLIILQTGKFASLTCNDRSLHRLGKLRNALALHVPAGSDAASRVVLKRKDAASVEAWTEVDMYDKILVDVPCNTDRHAVTSDEGNLFSPEMSNQRLNLPQEQTKMLINALRAVRVGGCVVYSTCTLGPAQNELVVENACALARVHYGIEAVERSMKKMERKLTRTGLYQFWGQCRRGMQLMPNLLSNFGPTYLCKLQRTK